MPKRATRVTTVPPTPTPPVVVQPRYIGERVKLRIVPISLKDANAYVSVQHRHHKPVQSMIVKFCIGVVKITEEASTRTNANGDSHADSTKAAECTVVKTKLVGACIVSRPIARHTDALGTVAEISRLVTDGTKNACSILYAAAARACQAMGYERIQTFILKEELGTSLQASGWEYVSDVVASNFDSGRKDGIYRKARFVGQPMTAKQKWIKKLNPPIGA